MTKPLSDHAREELRQCAAADVPCNSINPGVVWKLCREGLAEVVQAPSPFATHKGANIQHLRATAAGRALLADD